MWQCTFFISPLNVSYIFELIKTLMNWHRIKNIDELRLSNRKDHDFVYNGWGFYLNETKSFRLYSDSSRNIIGLFLLPRNLKNCTNYTWIEAQFNYIEALI